MIEQRTQPSLRTLAVDCCFDSCSAAIVTAHGVLAAAYEPMQRGQAERLPVMVAEVLEQARAAQLDGGEVDQVAVTCGPGTFTGVRIGLSFARAFALGRNVPCYGISSLAAVALAGGKDGIRIGVHAAPMDGFYVEAFDGGAEILAAAYVSRDEAVSRVQSLVSKGAQLFGTGAISLANLLAAPSDIAEHRLPDARNLAYLVSATSRSTSPAPLYLRAPDIRLPKAVTATALKSDKGASA